MSRVFRRVLWWLITVFVLGFIVCVGLRIFSAGEAQLTISNESQEKITALKVTVGKSVFQLDSIIPQESKKLKIRNYSDSHWILEGRWESGATFHEELGYITSGMSFDDHVVITKDKKLTFFSKPK